MKVLLDHRGDIDLAEMVSVRDINGRLPLHWALSGLQHHQDKELKQEIPLQMLSALQLLLDAKPDAINTRDKLGTTALHFVVNSGVTCASSLQAVKLLLDAKPDSSIFNAQDHLSKTALLYAVACHASCSLSPNGHFMQLLELIFENGADGRLYDNKGQTILHHLAMRSTFGEPLNTA